MNRAGWIILLMVVATGCAPSAGAVQTAIAETQAAAATATRVFVTATQGSIATISPSETPQPLVTSTNTNTSGEAERFRTEFLDVIATLETTDGIDVKAVTLARFDNGVLEIEIKTLWSSRDSQPDVSYDIIRVLSEPIAKFNREKFEQLAGGPFSIRLTSYSSEGKYRYQSLTDYDLLIKVANRAVSYDEWVAASGAGFEQ